MKKNSCSRILRTVNNELNQIHLYCGMGMIMEATVSLDGVLGFIQKRPRDWYHFPQSNGVNIRHLNRFFLGEVKRGYF